MTTMTPEERVWEAIVEEMIDEAASVSVADAEAYLTKAGFDVSAERAAAEAFLVSLAGPNEARAVEAVPQEAPGSARRADRKKPRPLVLWAAAAATAAAAGVVTAAYVSRPEPATGPTPIRSTPVPAPSPSPEMVAAELRVRATTAFKEGRAADCLALLEEARAKDPAGDTAPSVVRLRKDAETQLDRKLPSPK